MKKLALVIPVAMVSLLSFTPARADVVTNEDVPYSEVMEIPCTGDSVLLEGKIHYLIKQGVSNTGVQTFSFTINPAGLSGISAQGIQYQGAGTAVLTRRVDGNQVFQNVQYRTYIIGQGPGNDSKFFVSFVLNTDENGVPRVVKVVADDTCGING
jgi:hypothetical protein